MNKSDAVKSARSSLQVCIDASKSKYAPGTVNKFGKTVKLTKAQRDEIASAPVGSPRREAVEKYGVTEAWVSKLRAEYRRRNENVKNRKGPSDEELAREFDRDYYGDDS